MSAVALRFRAELRAGWRGWLGLAVLMGLAGAVVIGAAAGARRTDNAYSRFLTAYRASDVAFFDVTEGTPHAPKRAQLERLPQVAEVVPVQFVTYGFGDNAIVAARDNRPGVEIDRFKVLSGRLADPRRADEVIVSFVLAEKRHLHVGSTFPLFTKRDVVQAKELGVKLPSRNMTFRVVGIEASPGEFPPQPPGLWPLAHMTPAFYHRYEHSELLKPQWPSLLVRLKHGEQDVPAFVAEVERLSAGKPTLPQTQQDQSAPVRRSFHLQALALWILAALVGLTAALVFSQLIARQAFLDSAEAPTLRALGMTRGQLFGLGMARAAAVALPAGVVAVVVSFLLSPLTPIGEARIAEPSPGFWLDSAALGAGGVATVLLVLALAAIPVWRAARLAGSPLGTSSPAGSARPSAIASALSRAGLPPSAAAGVRMALEPGRGRTAVPVRTTLAGLALAITALTAAVVFGSSLDHLLGTPRLYGWNWDLQVTNYGVGPDLEKRAAALAKIPGITEFSTGGGAPLVIGRAGQVGAVAVNGPVVPPILEGRRPLASNEIALGTKTMRRTGLRIGESVAVHVPGLKRRMRMTVVGRVVVPPQALSPQLGEGALITSAAGRKLVGKQLAAGGIGTDIYVRLEPGADRRAVLAALRPKVGMGFSVVEATRPTDIVNFGRVQKLPVILAGILALLAAATLAHTLVSAARRRRRDLGVLKTVGFVPRQVFGVVLWQATTLAAIAVLVGVPLGVALGRWSWALFSDQAGVVREPVVPAWQIAVVVAGTLLFANLVAALPGRMAARTRPAEALRAE